MIAVPIRAGMAAHLHLAAAGRAAVADDVSAVQRYDRCRRALRVGAMSMPADALKAPSVAAWVRRRGVNVHTASAGGLAIALNAGIAPARITVHCNDEAAYTRYGVQAGVGRLVIRSQDQLDTITDCPQSTPRVLIDLSVCPDPHLAMRIVASARLELIGIHQRLDAIAGSTETSVGAMIAGIACLRGRYGHLVTRLSFAGVAAIQDDLTPGPLRASAEELEATVEDACARFRYPRPALVFAMQDIDSTRTGTC